MITDKTLDETLVELLRCQRALECKEPHFGYTKDDEGKQIACRIYNADQ